MFASFAIVQSFGFVLTRVTRPRSADDINLTSYSHFKCADQEIMILKTLLIPGLDRRTDGQTDGQTKYATVT